MLSEDLLVFAIASQCPPAKRNWHEGGAMITFGVPDLRAGVKQNESYP